MYFYALHSLFFEKCVVPLDTTHAYDNSQI